MNNQRVANYSGKGDAVQLGRIQKGDEKGTGHGGLGKDLGHRLRVVFDSSHENVIEHCDRFQSFYAKTGRAIHKLRGNEFAVLDIPFLLPLPNLDAFSFSYSVNISYPVAHSDKAGEFWNFINEPGTMKVLVYGGKVRIPHTDLTGVTWDVGDVRPVDPTTALFNYKGNPLMPKPKMTFKLLLPYLLADGYIRLNSKSINDSRYIYNQLVWIKSLAESAKFPLANIPLTILRREREITKHYGDSPHREESWMLSVEIADDQLKADLMQTLGGAYFFGDNENEN